MSNDSKPVSLHTKIKSARISSGLTQEQASQALGVSRQTISNWENGKTYPDIISAVKMSDLYHVSLDRLLKGEESGSDYLDYLEESTNTVKSKVRMSRLILLSVYFVVWTAALIAFWFFDSASDAMGYSLVYLWLLLPLTTFCVSLIIGINNYWEHRKWLSALVFGFMYMLAEYGTFRMANMIAFDKINMPEFIMIPAGAAISAAGLCIGAGIRYINAKLSGAKRESRQQT